MLSLKNSMKNNQFFCLKTLYMRLLFFFLIILLYLYSLPRYIPYLPTIPIYSNNEAKNVLQITKSLNDDDIFLFNQTDESMVIPFLPHVRETKKELIDIITSNFVLGIILFFKYLINRPRPKQILNEIPTLDSKTADTPAYPAGHAFQAYYLAHILKKKYPEKSEILDKLAYRCDEVRIKAGLHYPSDGKFSRDLVNFLINIHLI